MPTANLWTRWEGFQKTKKNRRKNAEIFLKIYFYIQLYLEFHKFFAIKHRYIRNFTYLNEYKFEILIDYDGSCLAL